MGNNTYITVTNMTIQQTANHFQCDKSVVLSWIRDGLPSLMVDGSIVICLQDVIQWIKDGKA